MPSSTEGITPHRPLIVTPNTSVRSIYIHNLVNLLHTCLLRNELDHAKRAWAILVRCREFDWKSRWHWGLLLLEHTLDISPDQGNSQTISSTYSSSHTPEIWLRDLQTRLMGEVDKPAILHARILYMIKHNQHRQALSELDLWLASYPYATSGPLHTYAGLLCFYLSQPEHTRPLTERQGTEDSSDYQETKHGFQVDKTLLRESRNWFQKALEIDKNDQVALDFIHLIDDSVDGHGEYSTNGYKDRKSDESDASDRDSIISSLGSDP